MSVEKIIASLPSKTAAQRGRIRDNAERQLARGTPEQQADARRLLAALDAHEAAEDAATVERLQGLAPAERVAEAFRATPPTETEEKVLRALLDHPGSTSAALTAACGWRKQAWHLHFGTMCERRETTLWPAEPAGTRDGAFFTGILADYDPATSTFTMKPEVEAAFAGIGIQARRPSLDA